MHFRGSLCVKGLAMPHRFARWRAGGNGGKLMSRKFGAEHFRCYICRRNNNRDYFLITNTKANLTMNFKEMKDFPTVFGERLSSIICEDVKDYLSEVKEYITKINKELRETQEERDDLRREVDKLRAEKEVVETDALRRLRAVPVEYIERFAKSSTSWADARPLYEMLLEYAEDDRVIKQKARNIKTYHTRQEKARSKQVFFQSKQTNINNPTFGSMYDIHDNDEVKAG